MVAALKLVEEITGQTVAYDPAAPEEVRSKALEELRKKLAS